MKHPHICMHMRWIQFEEARKRFKIILIMALQAMNPRKKTNLEIDIKYLQFFDLNLMNQTIRNNYMKNK
jgi:hypothetical protein